MPRPNINLTFPGVNVFTNVAFPEPQIVTLGPFRRAYESTSGVHRVKPQGWIPPTPYSVLSQQLTGAYGRHWSLSATGGIKYEGVVGFTDNSGPINIGAAFNQAMPGFDALYKNQTLLAQRSYTEALIRLKGKKVDLGVAFGERDQVVRMVGSAARNIARAVRQVRRGHVRDAMRTLGLSTSVGQPRFSNWTSNWLAIQYGVKPTLSEIYGATEALSELPRETWRVSAKGTVTENEKGEFRVLPDNSSAIGYLATAETKRGGFTRIDAVPDNDLFISLASIGVTNPLVVVWELVPVSFVVDWLLPVGDYLESLDALFAYKDIHVSTSTMARASWGLTGISGLRPGDRLAINDFSASKREFYLQRTITGAQAPPFPRIKNPWSLGHMANGLALLAQAFR